MKLFGDVHTKPDVPDTADVPKADMERPHESESWQNSIELPDLTDGADDSSELTVDNDEWLDSIELPDENDVCEPPSEAEINEQQKSAIKDALDRLEAGEVLTTEQKGNLCEMMMDQFYISKGFRPLHSPRITSINDKGHKGIDGVYEKDGRFVIADAKYGTAQLGQTQDGKQLSYDWINRRLDASVGKEKADEIRDAYDDNPSRVDAEVFRCNPKIDDLSNINCDVSHVDENGNQDIGPAIVVVYYKGEALDMNPDAKRGDLNA